MAVEQLFVKCCSQDLLSTACSILVQLPSSFFSMRLVSVPLVHPYSSMNATAAIHNGWYAIKRWQSQINYLTQSIFHYSIDLLPLTRQEETQGKFLNTIKLIEWLAYQG